MNSEPAGDCLKLTTYTAERERTGGRLLTDALVDVYARHALRTSVLLRGIEGFGARDSIHTQRLLTLSENLPIVTVAVDARERIEAVLPEVGEIVTRGLLTLERARIADEPVASPRDETKLTVYCGRQDRVRGRPAHVEIVDLLHRHDIAGATVLLGVDGTAHGARRRARFFARNAEVPLMIVSVGEAEAISRAIAELRTTMTAPLMTLERVQVLKRDGERLASPRELPDTDPAGLAVWRKLMVYTGEQVQAGGRPLYSRLVGALREAGADGATTLRGIWGYHGDHRPHGDRLLALRRHVPVVTIAVDTPARMERWWPIVDELTAGTGLVTSEVVPAFHAVSPDARRGGLRLARRL